MAKDRTAASARCCAPLFAAHLSDDDANATAAAFAVLGDPVRLRLLNLIANTETGEACACDLTEPVGRSQPTVSHHLKVLTEAGLVTREQRGRWAWFRVVETRLAEVAATLTPSDA